MVLLVVLTLPFFTFSLIDCPSSSLPLHPLLFISFFPSGFNQQPHFSLSLSLSSMGSSRIQNSKLESRLKGKRELSIEEDMEEEEDMGYGGEDDKKKKGVARRASTGGGVGGVAPPSCQAENCTADLTDAKRYYRRHKVCEHHSKAPVVIVAGLRQRFCQQCSRFHELSEFDEAKRSCRRRLAGHNERRRKNSSEFHGEGSSKENHCRQVNQSGRIPITLSGNSKHFQIR